MKNLSGIALALVLGAARGAPREIMAATDSAKGIGKNYKTFFFFKYSSAYFFFFLQLLYLQSRPRRFFFGFDG